MFCGKTGAAKVKLYSETKAVWSYFDNLESYEQKNYLKSKSMAILHNISTKWLSTAWRKMVRRAGLGMVQQPGMALRFQLYTSFRSQLYGDVDAVLF